MEAEDKNEERKEEGEEEEEEEEKKNLTGNEYSTWNRDTRFKKTKDKLRSHCDAARWHYPLL